MKRQTATLLVIGMAVGFGSFLATPVQAAGVRLTVKGDLDRDSKSEKKETKKSSRRSETESLTYELDIQVSNTTKQEAIFDLEWYFLRRPLDSKGKKGEPVLCEKDKIALTIGGQRRVSHKVTSETITNSESKTSKRSSGNGPGSSKSFSGDVYAGYVVLVKKDGKILAKKSNETKFTSAQWLGTLNGRVKKASGKKPSSSGKKKK